jgi:MFS family permease
MTARGSPWPLVALLCLTATASYLSRVNISIAAPLMMREFHLSQVVMGRIFSAFLLSYALCQVPACLGDGRTLLGWLHDPAGVSRLGAARRTGNGDAPCRPGSASAVGNR